MKSNQYRIWNSGKKAWCSEHVYLGQDGALYQLEQDEEPSLLEPEWHSEERFHRLYNDKSVRWPLSEKIRAKIAEEVKAKQHEWYTVEFATGYLDTADKMIFDGDIVHNNQEEENFQVAWGDFEDCCVNGEAWVLLPEGYEPVMGHWCSDEMKYRKLTIIGDIHTTPELIPKEHPM